MDEQNKKMDEQNEENMNIVKTSIGVFQEENKRMNE